jgi:transposase InsO family protein
MPEGIDKLPMPDLLTYEEIEETARAAARLGFRKLKVTGGEPLVRRNVPELIGILKRIPGIREVTVTTNGTLLGEKGEVLLSAPALYKINLSLQSFEANRGGELKSYVNRCAAFAAKAGAAGKICELRLWNHGGLESLNGEILSLEMRDNMKKELCVDTVRAMRKRFPVRGAILHSDRGSQYTSEAFRSELARQGLTQSLSGVAHCYDNARMESFFATLKKELIYRISAYRLSMAEVKSLVFRYVFVYYNRIRVYTANPGGWPPETWRRMYLKQAA